MNKYTRQVCAACIGLFFATVNPSAYTLRATTVLASNPATFGRSKHFHAVNDNGWPIPGLDGSTVIEQRKRSGNSEVYVTERRPLGVAVAPAPFDPSVYIRVESIGVYDARERPFCYWVGYAIAVPVGPNQTSSYHTQYGALAEVGASSSILYYDMNGDGRFETVETCTDLANCPKIPDWVTQPPVERNVKSTTAMVNAPPN